MLDSEVPLVNLAATGNSGVEVAVVTESPIGQLSVGPALRWRETGRERVAQGRILGSVIVIRKVDGGEL